MRPFDKYLHMPEAAVVGPLLAAATLPESDVKKITSRAQKWVEYLRVTKPPAIEGLLQDIGLGSPAGLALMGLAEALLRTPDDATINALIEDKLGSSLSTQALEADRLLARLAEFGLGISHTILSGNGALHDTLKQASLPFMRMVLRRIVRRMGHNFIIGEDVGDAFNNAAEWAARGHLMHYDMLGEGARTMADADRYYQRYQLLIDALKGMSGGVMEDNAGVSIKLSAIHPRFEELQRDRVMDEVYPRFLDLCQRAAAANIVLCVDAEEADRFEITLDVIERAALEPGLRHWQGLGFAVQAYQTRARAAVDWFIDLAARRGNRLTLRLVKGAYWDTEIKRGQERGLDAFPVFTRKPSTDCSYIACAKALLAARDKIYPQFASHNALTHATITQLAPPDGSYELQRLQGMGSVLFGAIKKDFPTLRTRIYAPVGAYEDLLTYLVRRLLENGANTSFVHQLAKEANADRLLEQPAAKLAAVEHFAHPAITLPRDMLLPRVNSQGWELAERGVQDAIAEALKQPLPEYVTPQSIVDAHFEMARQSGWAHKPAGERVAVLLNAADMLERDWLNALRYIVLEGKRTANDALSEIREAVDFCRYYALEAEKLLTGTPLPGPAGEVNTLHYHPRGTFVTIAPWNFPLAIFMGQTVAALAAGNTVITKPAEQTPMTGAYAVALLHKAGVPADALQLVQGDGKVGAALVAHKNVAGVAFTGSTGAAQAINRALAAKDGPIVPLIAETGGVNGMIVDSSALLEQVTDDVLMSGFRSAGQRCSALRVLFVQDDIADKLIEMISGAMAELRVGDPRVLATDVGPVIDAEAAQMLREYLATQKAVYQTPVPEGSLFIAPTLIELKKLADLPGEVFGPIVHIIRYRREALDDVIADINATGFGLTFGLHTRIMSRARYIAGAIHAGNVYVNRSVIGAVVGVQPFGGEGLSGTGPKAGGPNYVRRFMAERTVTVNTVASGGNVALMTGVSDD